MIVLVGTYFSCYLKAKDYAKSGDFESADKLLFVPTITKTHDANLITYIDAGKQMYSGRFDDAKRSFEGLSGYLEAEDMALEADYRCAMQYVENNDFDVATDIMKALAEKKYRDATEKVREIKFRKASYLLYEEEKYTEALVMFRELDDQGYSGANEMWSETRYLWAQSLISEGNYSRAYDVLEFIRSHADKYNDAFLEYCESLYVEGQRLYRTGKYEEAKKQLSCLEDYKDSDKYLTLISGRFPMIIYTEPSVSEMEDLRRIFTFEDASEVLLLKEEIACYFLEGTWRSGNGNYYFKMEVKYGDSRFGYDDSFKVSYNLTSHGGKFSIEDGIYRADGVPLFKFTLLTLNSMEVYCYKNGSTYTLYR